MLVHKKQFRFSDDDIFNLQKVTEHIKRTQLEKYEKWNESETIRYLLDMYCYENHIKRS